MLTIPSNENFSYVLSQLYYIFKDNQLFQYMKNCVLQENFTARQNGVFNQLPLWILCALRMNQVASQAAQAL